ncbi:hypothetical protein [Bradyrhizobium sp.]|uniref:hypothetical protein n=1 Tax=Bradyrhizobium sp. TaxID=376 RepID=UPI00273262FE|nr:hypothetical protein [Bradyrhizobium sp.]MDP3693439.1 hypothetical protein [Bradyrhizobium sp.]
MKNEVVFVAFRKLGLSGRGKVTPGFFMPIFEEVLSTYGVACRHYWADEFAAEHRNHPDAVVVLIYNEVQFTLDAALRQEVEEVERLATNGNRLIIHETAVGRVVADKVLTNQKLQNAGVSVPRLVSSARAPFTVFSNVNIGTAEPVQLLKAGAELDPSRYNTEFVDTRRLFKNRPYYVYLRAMCVGPVCVSITVRARPTDENDPSVHGSDMPLDAELVNHLHSRIVAPQEPAINDICKRIGMLFGTGFFSHDILPTNDAATTLFVCETGFKFDEDGFRVRFEPLKEQIPSHDFVGAMHRASHAFLAQVRESGFLLPGGCRAGN